MTTTKQNTEEWNKNYNWSELGEEWSAAWGTSLMQFYSQIFPRIHMFLPCNTLLEIAPGYGRWTQYLKKHCKKLIGVDLSESCITHCKKRFPESNSKFIQNDGKDLSFLKDGSIDFVFSFDSLVHANPSVLESYLSQLEQKLSHDGVGFIHHSNFGSFDKTKFFNIDFNKAVQDTSLFNSHCRDTNTTAKIFKRLSNKYNLKCIRQEILNWGGNQPIDCISIFTKKESKYNSGKNTVIKNLFFMKEAEHIRMISDQLRELGIL